MDNISKAFKIAFNSNFRKKWKEERRLFFTPRYTATLASLMGKEIKVPDSLSYLFMKKEIFEEEIYKFKCLSEEPYIIDGGANIGLASIYFKKLYPKAKIVAFEADPFIFDFLKYNLKEAFSYNDCLLEQKALWKEATTLNFDSEKADGGKVSEIDSILKVPAVKLSDYIDRKVDFLKLDIEGAETEVLLESADKLYLVQHLFVEYHSFVDQPQSLPELLKVLKSSGFRLFLTTPGLVSPHPLYESKVYNGMDAQVNIFGIRE